jgi:pimeloyl-ACP methyl ester carboxylesterase
MFLKSSNNKKSVEIKLTYKGYSYTCRVTQPPKITQTPVFFISGAFQNMDSWKRFENHFSNNTQVIVADFPGMGSADYLPENFGLDFYREIVKQILDELNIKQVYLVSTSYGSPIAYTFTQKYPSYVERLVLAGTMKEIPPHMKRSIEHSLRQIKLGDLIGFSNTVIDSLIYSCDYGTSSRANISERVLRAQLKVMPTENQRRYIANTRRLLNINGLDLSSPPDVPTLVFTGEFDGFTTPDNCLEIANSIPGTQFLTILDADHLFHIEQYQATIDLLECFGRQGSLEQVAGCCYYNDGQHGANSLFCKAS